MRSDRVRWFVMMERSCIPDHHLVVVGHRPEERLVQQVPRDVLHHGRVTREDGLGVENLKIESHRRNKSYEVV